MIHFRGLISKVSSSIVSEQKIKQVYRVEANQTLIVYPFGTGFGCGSPLFFPSVTCTSGGISDDSGSDQLVLTTHTGTYPITSISYSTSTLTISPSTMSKLHHHAPLHRRFRSRLGRAIPARPFHVRTPRVLRQYLLPQLQEQRPHLRHEPVSRLRVTVLLPRHALPGHSDLCPANSCCVYSPASLGPKGELDLADLHCAAYTSVMSYGDVATDPLRWQYGVVLKFGQTRFEEYGGAEMCGACESSGGVCGYTPRGTTSAVCAPAASIRALIAQARTRRRGSIWPPLAPLFPHPKDVELRTRTLLPWLYLLYHPTPSVTMRFGNLHNTSPVSSD
ncbi:unnamed protein product [Spirodela intermedia]|uniref:Uncharacterized protein n=1 Tax=Spirodela intermedia TaxID=51605 RepID=A0A7I8JI64_SPIIN|nr:unnamed protein product [Spirodela intermedia]CAA6669810.1 unnamed protein product [Spirodela intermedia]